MSEPVSSAEIEDVLSSIRRLVSNDAEASQEEVSVEPAKPEPAGKLILTADFRVAEPRDDAIEIEAPNDSDVEEVVSEDVAFEFHHTEQPAEAEAADEQSAAAPDENVTGLEDTIAELEAAIGQQDGEWEPDGSGFEEDAEAEEVMSEPVQDWIEGTAEDLDAETAVDAAEADTEEEDPDLFGVEDSVIDEETLRDMVSDIVRQELQGALGERITRNVRKLVRREINRVLASQDFD